MNFSYKHLVLLLCTVAFNFFVVLKTTNVSARAEVELLSCPSTLLSAVLKGDIELAEILLMRGADPNASLEGCRKLEFEDFHMLDWFPSDSSLLHVAAYVSNPRNIYSFTDTEIYELLVSQGAEEGAVNAAGYTPIDVFRNKWRDMTYSHIH